jgi:hypothetical protein
MNLRFDEQRALCAIRGTQMTKRYVVILQALIALALAFALVVTLRAVAWAGPQGSDRIARRALPHRIGKSRKGRDGGERVAILSLAGLLEQPWGPQGTLFAAMVNAAMYRKW